MKTRKLQKKKKRTILRIQPKKFTEQEHKEAKAQMPKHRRSSEIKSQ